MNPSYAIAVRAGTRLNDQLGAPDLRATIDVVYQEPASTKPAAPSPSSDDEDEGD